MSLRFRILQTVLILAVVIAGPRIARCQSAGAPAQPAPAKPAAAPATPPDRIRLLKECQSLAARQEYRQAEQLLTTALGPLADDKRAVRPTSADVALMTSLGEVLVNSGKYSAAAGWLERSLRAHEQMAGPARQRLADQAAVAILLAGAYDRLDKPGEATGILRTILGRYGRASVVDPVVQLGLLAELLSFDEKPSTPRNPSLTDETDRLADLLAADHQRGLIAVDDYARGLAALVDCRDHLSQWTAAAQTAEKLIRLRAGRRELVEELAARRRLAEIFRAQDDRRAEIDALRAALEAVQREQPAAENGSQDSRIRGTYERAEIERLLAAALLRDGRTDEAIAQLQKAEQDFTAALALARQETDSAAGVSAGRLLERIADVARQQVESKETDRQQLARAIAAHVELLDSYRQTMLADDPRIGSLQLILGGLYLQASDETHCEPLLQDALAYWRRREPPDRFRLAQTLHLLGETALASVPAPSADKIEAYLSESHRLCLAHFPADLLRWRTQLALGRLYVATGRYRAALDCLQPIATAETAVSETAVAEEVRSAALLQLGLLYKQLLKFEEANRFCRAGLELRQSALGENDPELAPFVLALGSLEIAQRNAPALDDCVARAAALGVAGASNPAWRWEFAHQQAMAHYLQNERQSDPAQRQAAREAWRRLLAAESDLPLALRARTLHYLSRLDYLDWSSEQDAWNRDFASGGARTSQELTRLTEELKKYQQEQTQFLADFAAYDPGRSAEKALLDREKQFHELLDRRAALEKKRLELRAAHAAALEREKQRAQAESGVQKTWLTKLAAGGKLAAEAIELLEQQGIYPSLQFTAMCNAAQLIEAQSRYTPAARDAGIEQALAKLDAAVALIERQRSHAVGDEVGRSEFFAQYHTAFDLLVQFHLDAHARGGNDEHLVQALVAAEQSRSRTLLDQLRMACIADPAGAPAPDEQPTPESLADLIRRWRDSQQPLLYYYVGSARSYLFLIGGSPAAIQPIRLQTGPEAADFSTTATDASARWIDLHVDRIHASLSDPESAATIGRDAPLRQRLVASSLVLLPRAARQYLEQQRQLSASHVVVVPHGAISQLPLEALVLDEGANLYLADVAPPLAYAPSLALLDHLSHETTTPPAAAKVLTLGNPDYAPAKDPQPSSQPALRLAALPASQKECDRIEASFGKRHVTRLDGARASEPQLRQALAGGHFSLLHLAAHGVLEKDDLNPWLALAHPSASGSVPADGAATDTDGRLDLGEIYRLPLAGCELTVLSACNTNLDARQTARLRTATIADGATAGPVAPTLDTGFSIANAFLAAGSRRVIGTQWTVSDDSTAEFIARYFEKLQAQLAAGHAVDYAGLLAEVRAELRRDKPEWNTPYYWAPFVLIGPADSRPTP